MSTALADAVRAELVAAGRLDGPLGQTAMVLAERIDTGSLTGSGLATVSKELDRVMRRALEGVPVAADPLDELRARRDRKRPGP